MDAAPRSGSVRHKRRPGVRRPSFRDDMNLVAIRYEKTAWGDAPTPVTTINPVRSPSRPSSSASSRSRSNSRSSGPSSPIVVMPPPGSVAPPTEEHPALRQRPVLPRTATALNEWKRDSGHGGATASSSSTPTISEEDCEDCWDGNDDDGGISPLSPLPTSSPTNLVSASGDVQQQDLINLVGPVNHDDSDGHSSVGTLTPVVANHELRPTSSETIMSDPGARPSPPASLRPAATRQTRSMSVTRVPMPTTTSSSPRRNLAKSFSLRSVSLLPGWGDGEGENSRKRFSRGGSSSQQPTATGLSCSTPDASVSAPNPPTRANPPMRAAQAGAQAPLVRGSPAPEAAADDAGVAPTSAGISGMGAGPGAAPGAAPGAGAGAAPVAAPSAQNLLSSLWKRGPFQLNSPRSQSHPAPAPTHRRPRRDTNPEPSTTIPFCPLSVSLPSEGLLDDELLASLSFSTRGSVMFGGKRALSLDGAIMDAASSSSQRRPSFDNGASDDDASSTPANNLTPGATPASESAPRSVSPISSDFPDTGSVAPDALPQPDESQSPSRPPSSKNPEAESQPQPQPPQKQQLLSPPPDIRVLAADVDRESQKVRSLYAVGDAIRWEDGGGPSPSSLGEPSQAPIGEAPAEEDAHDHPSPALLAPSINTTKSADSSSLRPSSAYRKETDLAGGFEDWEDLDGAIVDRYGFITAPPRPASSRLGTPTERKSARFHPRKSRRNVLQKKDGAAGGPSALSDVRPPSRKVSARSLNTQHSGVSAVSFRSHRSVIRQASNLLPHNRDRRWMDEAGDMLTVSPSLQDVAEEARVEQITEALKRKEWERSEKWRKMAKNVKKGAQGEGMEFEFDVKNPKLIERTWKGVPDCWRSAAWWSFLDTSARNHPGSPSTEEIIADFHRLQENSSPDDVQIDLDVPRTIGRHIMFRRRYQGGQRLLFRVLHALSIYFPATGYVQGMAPLGATLLCYFDEEKCFVMLVRMWQLRGLERLYRHGFEGLMAGLREFEDSWLHKDVAKHLTEQGIDSTAYGTRWYLTLFNLSIPFPAQLRVWDVFLLLGTSPSDSAAAKSHSKKSAAASPPSTGLDILHAASAALIQALREILLGSDFENAMKALTSFIPIKDEDLLMKVAKAEWKAHQRRKKA